MIYTIIDLETNGTSTNYSEILEVGYIQINSRAEILRSGQFYFYKPEWQIGGRSYEVNKLSRTFLESMCPDQETFNKNLVKLFTLTYGGVIIGKNSNKFDIPLINSFLYRNTDFFQSLNLMGTLDLQNYYCEKYREYHKKRYGVETKKKGTLTELIDMLGFKQEDIEREFIEKFKMEDRTSAHSALYDVFMTYLLVIEAKKRYGLRI